MSCLFRCHLCLEEASAKPQVADKVEELVSCAFVREAEHEVAEIAVFAYLESRHIEQLAHAFDLLVCHRMLHDHDRIVHITSLHEIVVEQELDLMEENECPAYSDLFRIYDVIVPYGILDSDNP